jgi:uncharacterized RDD family membrane protein YckC
MFKRFRKGNQRSSLTQGNIVSLSLQLYRTKGNNYFVTSLLAHLWLTLLLIGIFIGSLFFLSFLAVAIFSLFRDPGTLLIVYGATALLILLVSPFIVARFTASGGLIARQMFWTLRGEKEAVDVARAAIYPRVWDYGLSLLLTWLLLLLVYIALTPPCYFFYRVWFELLWLPASGMDGSSPMELTILLGLILLVLLFTLLPLYAIAYFTVRLSFTDVILAIEPGVTAWQSVVRSWQITRSLALHSLTVFFIGSIITFVGGGLANLLNFFVPIASLFYNVATFPFWQGIKTGLYYDLRCRNEGLNFELSANAPSPRQLLRRVTIQTPESIELDFALAGVGSRTLAWIVDQLIIWVSVTLVTVAGLYIYSMAIYPALEDSWLSDDIKQLQNWLGAIYLLLVFVLFNGYYIIFETAWQGQTPGKRLAEIRVVRDSGQTIGLPQAAMRSLVNFIDYGLFFIGLILVVFSKSEKRLGDLAAGTLVIQDESLAVATKPKVLKAEEISPASKALAYQLLENDHLGAISPDQYLALRDFINQRSQFAPRTRLQTANKLAEQLQPVVLPTEQRLPPQVSEEEFLVSVYLAYRRYHRSGQAATSEETQNGFDLE